MVHLFLLIFHSPYFSTSSSLTGGQVHSILPGPWLFFYSQVVLKESLINWPYKVYPIESLANAIYNTYTGMKAGFPLVFHDFPWFMVTWEQVLRALPCCWVCFHRERTTPGADGHGDFWRRTQPRSWLWFSLVQGLSGFTLSCSSVSFSAWTQ